MTRLQLRFRTKLLVTLLALVTVTTAAVGISSNLIARRTAEQLTDHILEQTAARIEQQVVSLLESAASQGELTRRLLARAQLQSGDVPTAADFPKITAYFGETMATQPHLTFMSLGLEATGEYCHVERRADGSLVAQFCIRNSAGKIERSDYRMAHGALERILHNPDWEYDPRTRPYYKTARAAARQVWTDVYLFLNDPLPPMPGVTCATPLYQSTGALIGVISVDFSLQSLCSFLRNLKIGREGFAVVEEARQDGNLQVIALPDSRDLIDRSGAENRLVPTSEMKNDRIRALMQRLDALQGQHALHKHGQVAFSEATGSYIGTFRRLAGQQLPDWYVCTVVPEAEIMSGVWRSNQITLVIGLTSLLVALLISIRVSRQVAKPLEELANETEAIGRLELENRPVVPSGVREIHRLAAATEEMKTGLRSFRKYVPADLVRLLLASGHEAKLGGERKRVTVWFSDIADFTTIAEQLSPDALVEQLGEHVGALSDEILKARGTVDKYIGDSIMAFWGAPESNPRHATDACRAAIHSRARLGELHARHLAQARPLMRARFGLATGEVIVGNIGSEARLNYTVVGDTVNLANRLEGLNKFYGTEILMSETTFLEARSDVVARPVNWVAVKGRAEAVLVYELLGLKGATDQGCEEFSELCSRGLASYSKQDWMGAIRLFEEVLKIRPNDRAAQMIVARCRSYQEKPPGEKWDRAHRMDAK